MKEGGDRMRRPRFSLRTKLILCFLAIIVVGGFLSLGVGSQLIRRTLISQAQDKVRHDLSSAWMVFDEKLNDIKNIVRLTAARESLRDLLQAQQTDILLRYLGRVRVENRLDALTLLDGRGRVLLRTSSPENAGDDRSRDEIVRRALEREIIAGPQIVPREELLRDGDALAAQALIPFISTPMATPHAEDRETDGMMLQAAAPILKEDGSLIGVLTGGVLVNRNYEIVDRIKGIVFKEGQYKGRETGTATIFQNDLRISTNVKDEKGRRAVGTLLMAEVKKTVLDEGRPWVARAFVVNDWYITAYEPIKDVTDRIIGILYVGTLERPYLDTANRVMLAFILIAGLCVVFLLVVLYFMTTRMVRPLERVVVATQEIAKGDLSHKLQVTSRDEIGALASSFNEMTDHLREANEKLLDWGRTLEGKVEERTQELRDIQSHLIQSEKLASIGKLAAGIAHEINNPLGAVLLYSHLILEDTPEGQPHHGNLKKIVKETTRCKDIVSGLLDFARPKEPQRQPTDVHDLLNRCLAFTEQQALFQNIRVEKVYAPGLPKIVADGGQLQQVFMNIIFNAAEAMDGTGTLTLRTTYDGARDEVAVAFSDTGHGINAEDKVRLFEPFFTTKDVGKGTGLGLAISYGIIQRHHGTIEVESEAGRGAKFTIRLPRQASEP
jgi:two-component system NtrC family sensor kinase